MKDDRLYLLHILECIQRIESYTGGGEKEFMQSTLIQDAVLRNLQILAESTQRLSDALKNQHADVPWRQIAGFRNVLAHDYQPPVRSTLTMLFGCPVPCEAGKQAHDHP